MSIREICEQVRDLPELEKLALVDALLAQLDQPDPAIDSVWAEESRKRREAFLRGHLQASDYETVMEGFLKP